MGYTSPTKIARIVTLREEGKTIHDIAERVGKDPSTVSRIAREYPKRPDFYSVKVKSGRPRKMTEADTRYCARALAKVEVKTAADVQRKIFPVVSAQTIRRALVNYGLSAYRRRRKPLLTAAHVKKRHNWAQEHKDDDVRTWKKVWAAVLKEEKAKLKKTKRSNRHQAKESAASQTDNGGTGMVKPL